MRKLFYSSKILLVLIFVLPLMIQCGGPASAPPPAKYYKPLYKWVELGPDATVTARAVTKGSLCPEAVIDSKPVPMRTRAAREKGKWDVTVCETAIPAEAKTVSIDGEPLPLLKKSPSRVLVIGDTGCTITDEDAQGCNDRTQWLFPDIAESALHYKPDLIIHVGDYTYRDSLCPTDKADCHRSPFGDNFDTWEADLLMPARNLLSTAPWIFLRGDREHCLINPNGWFRLLDPFPYSEKCENYSEPYNVVLDTLTLSVIDSTNANDDTYSKVKSSRYASYIKTLENSASKHRWFLTHRPVWAVAQNPNTDKPDDMLFTLNSTLQTAFRSADWSTLLSKYDMLISGHLQLFDMFGFNEQGTPPQFVIGNGGTLLHPALSAKIPGNRIGLKTLKNVKSISTYGYVTIEPDGDGWSVTVRDKNGKPVTVCSTGSASCK